MSVTKWLFPIIIVLMGVCVRAEEYQPDWSSLDERPVPEWFADAKFGIFIHWGVYSVPSWRKLESERYASYAEWYYARVMDNRENGGYDFHRNNYGEDFEYRDFAPLFRAELFDPESWARMFSDAGAKYVVLTAKHHDGYCLWPTDNPHKKNWNAGDIGPKRDLVGDLASEVRSAGMKMGLYYSIPDWESVPMKLEPEEYFIRKELYQKYSIGPERYRDEVLNPQLKELVTQYRPSLLFSDAGEWLYDDEFWQTKEFLAWLYTDSPSREDVVVNDRWCKGSEGNHGDYFSSEYEDASHEGATKPWEESRGIGGSYGYNRAENLADYSTSQALIHELINIVSRGGNLLLNVGPTADGRIPVIMQQRLADIGQWLRVNGEAIYGTHRSELSAQQHVRFTEKGNQLYGIATTWQDSLTIPVNGRAVKQIQMLGSDVVVAWEADSRGNLIVKLPPLTVDRLPCQHAWVLKMELQK